MARPKNIPGQDKAYDRIVKAFWLELSEKNYSEMTVSALAKRANVNHNSLYYYFSNLDEIAQRLFIENMNDGEVAQCLFEFMLNSSSVEDLLSRPNIIMRLSRAKLYARGDSAYLMNLFQQSIMSVWLNGNNLSSDKLTIEDRHELKFIFGGLTTLLGSYEYSDIPKMFSALTNSEIGTAVKNTLKRIRAKL